MRISFVLAIVVAVLGPMRQTRAEDSRVKKVGYEVLQIKSFNEIIAWASKDITREQFDAIKLPLGWMKNQPREVEMDGAKFLNSPGLEEGSFSRAKQFGHEWLHVATVKLAGRKHLDSKGLLVGSAVVKNHIAKFDEGRTLKLLISPSGEVFPRITRDANRTREEPTLPEKWRLIEHTLDRPIEFKLTGETTVIRTDNQDSFQGPVKFSLNESQPEQSAQSRGGGRTTEATTANSAEPSYGRRNDKQWARMRSLSPDEDREFLMVNLIKYRTKAKYADGRKTDLTGEQANALYAPIEFIGQIGAGINYMGRVKDQMGNMNPRWDEVAIVRYPSRAKFFEMVTNPEFQKRAIHKDAGLEVTQVLLTESVPWKLSGAKRVADKDDAFTLAQLLKYRETANYADDRGVKRKQTGKKAMDAFDVATEGILRDFGARRMLKTSVEGALIGDGRTWDEFRMLHFPSESAYTAYCDAVEKMSDAVEHREAAIEDSYRMKAATMPLAKRLAISLATSVLGQQPIPSRKEAASTDDIFKDGANCLFIGHSFFVPVARSFDAIATKNGFSSHQIEMVFSPGPAGTAGKLWDNPRRRKQIEDKLATGKIALLGMTVGKVTNAFEDYQRWIDLALKYNPKTRFFIGHCWTPGGPKMPTSAYSELIEISGTRQFDVVAKLRKAYPDNHIYFINYGKTASIMRAMFEDGELHDIEELVGRNKRSLFLDGLMGHGGPMMLELSALTWLKVLYGADIEKLERGSYNAQDVTEITNKVLSYNQRFDSK